jgi:nitrogen regulatory protein PII
MKRLAFIVKPENLDDIILSLREIGLEATIYDVKGIGKEDSERVSSGRGSGTSDIGYTTRKIIATVVSSDHINDIVQ